MAIFIWFFYILFLICFAYSCRCIQTLGPQYWSPWTIKVCGTSGLQYGIGSTLGNNCISESGMQPTTLPMNMTFLLTLYFVAKPWEGSLSTTHYYLFEAFFLSKNILIFQSWGFDYKTTHKEGRKKIGFFSCTGLYLYVSNYFRWIYFCLYDCVICKCLDDWIHFILEVCSSINL